MPLFFRPLKNQENYKSSARPFVLHELWLSCAVLSYYEFFVHNLSTFLLAIDKDEWLRSPRALWPAGNENIHRQARPFRRQQDAIQPRRCGGEFQLSFALFRVALL